MTETESLKLQKPNYTEPADIQVINANMDKIEANSKTHAEAIIDLHNNKMEYDGTPCSGAFINSILKSGSYRNASYASGLPKWEDGTAEIKGTFTIQSFTIANTPTLTQMIQFAIPVDIGTSCFYRFLEASNSILSSSSTRWKKVFDEGGGTVIGDITIEKNSSKYEVKTANGLKSGIFHLNSDGVIDNGLEFRHMTDDCMVAIGGDKGTDLNSMFRVQYPVSDTTKVFNLVHQGTTAQWNNFTMQNNFIPYSAIPLKYCKIGGAIFAKGTIKHQSGTSPLNTILATLPAGFRPDITLTFTIPIGSSSDTARLEIRTDGTILIVAATNQTALNQAAFLNVSFAI